MAEEPPQPALHEAARRVVLADPVRARELANELCHRGTRACGAAAAALRCALAHRASPFMDLGPPPGVLELDAATAGDALGALREHVGPDVATGGG